MEMKDKFEHAAHEAERKIEEASEGSADRVAADARVSRAESGDDVAEIGTNYGSKDVLDPEK